MYAGGSATKLGQLYQGQGGTLPSAAFDAKAVARREGNTESIPLLNGRAAVTCRWDLVDSSYKLTAVGKAYYRTKQTQYVVHAPVTIQGRRQSGADYGRASWMPISTLGLQNVDCPRTCRKNAETRISDSLCPLLLSLTCCMRSLARPGYLIGAARGSLATKLYSMTGR